MDPVNPHGQNDTFSSWPSHPKQPIFEVKRPPKQFTIFIVYLEFRPHFHQIFLWRSAKTLAMEPVVPHNQNIPFSSQFSLMPKRPIFKVKRPLKQNFDLLFAKNFCGRPLRP
ncbi:hypothetical protein H5410_044065 [Solanum commersonii]|uniref:Uncharacterized protein n=1 Tax=Solanum commersonii TaxID=4109 RepID=A0A9J5Y129_SOLCO|nr:hypothetical protein H5410_044065 [Solanum commersonii]